MFSFYTPWKDYKPKVFGVFENMKLTHWLKRVEKDIAKASDSYVLRKLPDSKKASTTETFLPFLLS